MAVEPKTTQITSGQAFIGGCATRANALILYTNRIFQILVLNMAGLITVTIWLATMPVWYLLVALVASLVLGILRIYKLSKQIIIGSAANVDLWTNKLIALEKANGIDGGVAFFSSQEYEVQRSAPSLPKGEALWLLRVFVVLWALVGIIAFLMTCLAFFPEWRLHVWWKL